MLATRVLLVDDDEVVRMALTEVLELSGFTITSAANVPEALRLICGKESYDVLLSESHLSAGRHQSRYRLQRRTPQE